MTKFTLQFILWCAFCICSLSVKAQVTASFTTDDTAGCAPLVVHFASTSTGATGYSWNLGNGTPPPTTPTASTAYTAPGTYTVTLTANNGTTTSTATTIIRVYSNPTVNFTANDTSVCPGTPVTFSSSSTPGSWGSLTYTWNFGDGSASTANSPVYSYGTPGFYNVTLYATNVKGCVGSRSVSSYMHVFTPAAVAFHSATIFCKPPATVPFTNSTTGTAPLTYTWKYGDGSPTSSTISPTHTYTAAGAYTVSLKVTDGNGCTDSLVQASYINVGGLAAAFTPTVATVCVGIPINFTNTSTSHISSNWSFGDGATTGAESPVHSYSVAGTYTARLIIYNGGTCFDTVTHTITVSPSPTASFTITPAAPCPPPTALTLTGTASGGASIAWNFGDSTTGSGATVTHTFHLPKVYFVQMIATSTAGCKDTVYKSDTAYSLAVNASTTTPTSGCAPLSVNFNSYDYSVVSDSVYNPFPLLYISYPYSIAGYSWNFADGSPPSTLATPVHSYTAAGIYNATLTITTANGCTSSTIVTIRVGVPPVASFTATPRRACTNRTTTFTSTSTGIVDNYSWNFGDGGSVAGPGYNTVVHIDSVPGIHTVYLTAYDNFCPSSPFSLTDTVDSPKSIIGYTYTCIPNNGISFTDASMGDNSHTWIFGDGTTSTAANPTHYYPSLADYTIKLATYNAASGCRDTSSVVGVLVPPVISFTSDSIRICRDKIDTILSSVIGSYPVNAYKWYDNGTLAGTTTNLIDTFRTRGLHTISLVITDNRNCLDTFTRTNYINVAKPIDNYSFTPTSGCAPLPVAFTDLSTDVAGAPVKKFFWSFGDAVNDTLTTFVPTISHIYSASGTYTIQEIVTDTIGCKDTLTTSTLSVNKPTAAFTISATNVCANTAIHFTNASFGYASSSWSFGDGAVSTITSPDHAYTTPGVYTVRLVVYSSLSCTDTMTYTNYITVNPSPHASFYMNDSFAICPPLNVTFTNTSTGATSYSWTFGDSTGSFLTNPGDIYVHPGLDTVRLVAFNSYGCTDTAIGHTSIFGYTGAFSYTPVSGCSPLTVHFSTSASGSSNLIWDFGDGITAITTTTTTNHTYSSGSYVPKLLLTDNAGCSSFSLGADTIKADTVIAAYIAAPNPACINVPITFTSFSSSLYSTITSSTWTFLSGVTSSSVTPVYSYSVSGTYPVTLSVTDGNGCTGSKTANVSITAPPSPITGTTSFCAGYTSTLSDVSAGTWSISGSGVATIGSSSGIVTGVAHGTATVTFTSTSGCILTTVVTIFSAPGSISGPASICSGNTATFSDTSSGGTWSSSNTLIATVNSSGLVTGGAAGTAIITYSTGGSCPAVRPVTVSLSPTSIDGPTTVCAGSTATETNGVTGGTWASSNTAVATIGSTGIVTGIMPGTTIISYSPGAGCVASKIITVNAIPASITGTQTVCQSLTTHLADATSGGTWSSSSSAIATVTSAGVVTGAGPGVATIYYTNGGCAASAIVTVYATPTAITSPVSVCAGATASFTDGVTGGTWASSNTAVATIGSSSGMLYGVSPLSAPGTATITYSLAGGCSITTTVTVNATAPITGVTALCSGLTSTLNDAITGGTWFSGNTSVASIGSLSGFLTSANPGNATITYTLPTGCTTTTIVTINTAPTAITGATTTCVGATAQLIDGGGGTWSIAGSSIATVTSPGGVISGIAPGTATVTYSLGSGCTRTAVITVYAAPAAPTGPLSVCMGQSVTLTGSTTAGTWSEVSSAVATVDATTGAVGGVTAGTTVITYTAAATGCSSYATFTVNVIPALITGPTSACVGGTIALADASTGGTWSTTYAAGATVTATSGIVTGVSAGILDIVYTLPNTCARTIAINITALPSPITGNSNLCIGNTATLTDTARGGVWSTTPGTAAIATIGSSSGTVSGIGLGTTTVTYSLGGACTAYRVISVNPLPSAITGFGSVCTNSLITLSDITTGGTWTSSNTAAATIDTFSGIVSGVFPGTATITYTSAAGCTTTRALTIIAGIPPITGTTHICTGGNTTLADALSGGTWSSSNTLVAPVTGGFVNGLTAGTASISYITGSGCPAIVIVTINPLPGPISGDAHICLRLPYTFSDTATGGAWSTSTPATATVGAISGVVSGIRTGTATIIYALPTGCFVTTSTIIDTVPPGIIGPNHMCVGQSITLTDTLFGGTWSTTGPLITGITPTGTGTTANISGLSAGVVNISYTQGGCPALLTVIVNQVPGPIQGVTNICAYGGTSHVSDSSAGGIWTSSTASVSSVGDVVAYAAGTAVLTYTLPTGCRTMDTFTVNPRPGPITGTLSICLGGSITLSDTSLSGVWSSLNTAVATIGAGTGVSGGVSAGTADIIYSLLTTGCKDTVTVTVYPHPSVITGTAGVCSGSTTVLTDSIAGGSWQSSNPTVATVSGGIVDGFAPGSSTITYTLAAGCTATRTVTVWPLPAVHTVTGGGGYCSGGTGVAIGLNGSNTGIRYYLYNGTALVDSTSGSGSVVSFGLQTVPGTYTVTAANTTTGCGSSMTSGATITIIPVVIPSVSITPSPNDTVCAGTPVTFTASPVNQGSTPVYQWTVNGASVGTSTLSYSYAPAANDSVSVVLVSSAACAAPDTVHSSIIMAVIAPVALVVTVTTAPGTTVSPGDNITFSATVTNGSVLAYQWIVNNTIIPGATNATFSQGNFSTGDSVSCVVISSGYCDLAGAGSAIINITHVGVASVTNDNSISILPNPNKGDFTIKGSLGSTDDNATLEITDMLGQVVYTDKLVVQSGKVNQHIVLSNAVANGMYLINIRSGGNTQVFHMVLEQ